MKIKKLLFILFGFISLFLGILGIVLPGLPTTPFLLLTAWLFVRSSDRLYNWLIEHRIFGSYIKNFQKGMSLRTKIISIAIMWTMIFVSVFFFINNFTVQIIVIIMGVVGTFVMSFIKQPEGDKILFGKMVRKFQKIHKSIFAQNITK